MLRISTVAAQGSASLLRSRGHLRLKGVFDSISSIETRRSPRSGRARVMTRIPPHQQRLQDQGFSTPQQDLVIGYNGPRWCQHAVRQFPNDRIRAGRAARGSTQDGLAPLAMNSCGSKGFAQIIVCPAVQPHRSRRPWRPLAVSMMIGRSVRQLAERRDDIEARRRRGSIRSTTRQIVFEIPQRLLGQAKEDSDDVDNSA